MVDQEVLKPLEEDKLKQEPINEIGRMSAEIADLQHQLEQARLNHRLSMKDNETLRQEIWRQRRELEELKAVIEMYRKKSGQLEDSVFSDQT